MKLAYAIYYVPDVPRALDFYERAFGLTRRFLHESGEYGELDTGATTLAFASLSLADGNFPGGVTPSDLQQKPASFEIAFTTPDVPAALARAVAAGALEVAPPKLKPWGQTVAYLRDPNGNLVELCTPIG